MGWKDSHECIKVIFACFIFESNRANRAALRQVYASLQDEGVDNLHYLPGDQLLGADGEDTVDGSHPTDLGFMRQAEAFYPLLKSIVNT